MGNSYGYEQAEYGSARQTTKKDLWLQNQTFRIHRNVYTLRNRLGKGTFGSVWASTTRQGQNAAVKVFNFNKFEGKVDPSALLTSFQDEVKTIFAIRNARNYVVNVYDFDFDAQRRVALLAMELGNDSLQDRAEMLHETTSRSRTYGNDYISAIDRKNIWIQLVTIVRVLDQHGIVHCDLKPANFVFFGPRLKVIDLGIAQKALRGYTDHLTASGGTRGYSAPECFDSGARISRKADIWSLGTILYYLTYGVGCNDESPQPPERVPQTRSTLVQHLFNHCLQRDPNRRPTHRWLAHHPLTASAATV
ncbi:unnamed protein product [Adineta steineri]|uniref:Protein kinase domain-containing protein n=1 Tax=Adineta steineri TaxID=433720 RepID=A0A813VTT5_9BILA|nr:unnamed protein product [Adineta steineri]CAF1171371.1 unnamed protein product [Adineta steineri]CAF1172706.1 unnamed protein product [Adineta steineri]